MRRGFTIAELLVSVALLSIIGVIFAFALRGFIASSHQGSQRVEMETQLREATKRTNLTLRSAIAPSEIQTAIYAPAVGATGPEVIFCAPAELMDPTTPFDPRNPVYELFRIRQLAGPATLVLESVYGAAPQRVLGRQISDFQVERLADTVVTATIEGSTTIRGASGQSRTQTTQTKTSIQLPFK
ncbi:MAG: prepilin-type N-terminal cleavage/methylation domain-containing protein [Candidatus Eremiobacteraeota bacterium]|nr:prepilin-type N-terminal cleavage/methylation domain-containing protein [Candidatus Eremiobacteraeota bacterium]